MSARAHAHGAICKGTAEKIRVVKDIEVEANKNKVP